jgi:hypothetical protein
MHTRIDASVRRMTEAELVDYFNEHVLYELLMLRYSIHRLENATDQMSWNVMFAAFNVSARNLYYFLGKRDGNNANVSDYKAYCQAFARGSIEPVKETMSDLNAQCLHLGKARSKEADGKINGARVKKMSSWIESNMDELLKSFKTEFRSKVRPERAELPKETSLVLDLGPTGPTLSATTSSHPTLVNTGTNK